LSTRGSLFVTRPTLKDYVATRADLEARAADVFEGLMDGSLKVSMEHVFALEDAAKAQVALASRGTTGKLLLVP
jgi:NADPH2:quinone reductase